jgi:hypothetical protein
VEIDDPGRHGTSDGCDLHGLMLGQSHLENLRVDR